MSNTRVQILIVGSGFAGSLMAMIARRLGYSTLLLERGTHPRFAIGESSTPLANLLLEEMASRYDLAGVRPLCKWGSWQVNTPHVACGLTLTQVGHVFARDRTTVAHACGRVEDLRDDPSFDRSLELLEGFVHTLSSPSAPFAGQLHAGS